MAGLLGGRYKDKGRQPWSARQAGEAAHPGRARAPGAPHGFPGGISEGTRRSWQGANPRGGEKLPFQHAKRRDVGVKATQVEKAARAAVQSRPRCAPAAARAAPRATGFARRVRGEARAPQRHTGGPGRAASTHRLMERRCLPRHRGRPGEGPSEGRRGRDTRGARERALPGAASVRPKAGPPLRPRPRARGQRGAGAQVPRPPGLAPRAPPGLRADSAAPAPGRDTLASPTSGNTRQPPRGPSSTVRHSLHPKTGTWGGRSPRSSPVSAPTAGEAVNCAR